MRSTLPRATPAASGEPAPRPRRPRDVTLRVPVWLVGLVVAVLLMRLVPLPFKQIFIVLFTAVLLASAIAPAPTRLERYHVPRGISILLAYLAIVAIIAALVALLVPLIISEINNLQTKLPTLSDDLNGLLRRFTPPGKQPLSTNDIFSSLSGDLTSVAKQLGDLLFRVAGILVQVLVILVAAYFLAADPEFAERLVARFAPPGRRESTLHLLRRIGTRMGHWVRAQLVLALFFGLAFGIGMAVLRVPYPLTLGVTGGVLELIPYVGGLITVVLASLVALTSQTWQVPAVIIWYTVVTNVEAHVLAPMVMGRILGLHPLTVVVALFVGTETLGILGALLSVPIAVVIQVTLDELYVMPASGGLERELPVAEGVPLPQANDDG